MSLLNETSNNNNENQSATIVFGVMRQIIGNVFNPQNELCGSIAFGNLTSLEESLAICEGINKEIQANPKHNMQGERFIPIQKIGGVWYEIRRDVLLPTRMNFHGRDEFFVDGGWSVETPPTPSTQILKLGETRQVSELGDQFVLVTSDHEIGDILEGVGYKPSSSDNGVLSFDEIASSSLFTMAQDGGYKQVWGCYQLVPHKGSYVELIWHDNMSDEERKELEGRNPSSSVQYFIGMRGYSPNEFGLLSAGSWTELREKIADLFTSQFEDWDNEDEAQELFDTTLAKILLASKPEEIPYLGNFDVVGITFSDWVIGDSPIPPSPTTPSPTTEQEQEEEKYFSSSERKSNEKNNEAEAAFNNFMESLNSDDEEALAEIARDAFEPLVYKIVPKDDDKEANNL